MRINTKIRYGLRTIIEIANSPNHHGVLQKDIAKNQDISLKYLDSIILALKVKGLIENEKGKGSGYILSKPSEEITMWDVYSAFEPIIFVDCINNNKFCERNAECSANDFWCELKRDFELLLLKRTLAQVIQSSNEKLAIDSIL